jgi:hypothetical protein
MPRRRCFPPEVDKRCPPNRAVRRRVSERPLPGQRIWPGNGGVWRIAAVRPAFDHPVGRRGGPVAFMVKQRPPIK